VVAEAKGEPRLASRQRERFLSNSLAAFPLPSPPLLPPSLIPLSFSFISLL